MSMSGVPLSCRRSGLTLIEVGLVTSLIGLLAAMLLPALGTAREQARVQQCVANLGRIGVGSSAYLAEFSSLPFVLQEPYEFRGMEFQFALFTEFAAFGGLPNKSLQDWLGSLLVQEIGGRLGQSNLAVLSDCYNVPPIARPLNRYLDSEVGWTRPLNQRLSVPMSLPGVFRCPSDSSAGIPAYGGETGLGDGYSSWDWWGNSYAISWWWVSYYTTTGSTFLELLGGTPGKPGRGPALLADATGRQASELVLFMETRLLNALQGSKPQGYSGPGLWGDDVLRINGWHGRFNRHAGAFRDGSARYQVFDTQYNHGDGWTVWPKRPWLPPWDQIDGVDP